MTRVHFIADAHLGHENIAMFAGEYRPIQTSDDNTAWICDFWNEHVSHKTAPGKRDIVYCLGDMAFTEHHLELIGKLPGRKILIKGNHDDIISTWAQSQVFEEIYGLYRYKNWWLSHAPIHPEELRGKPNIHGHVHHNTLADPRYFNICPENLMRLPLALNPRKGPMLELDELRFWTDQYHNPQHA